MKQIKQTLMAALCAAVLLGGCAQGGTPAPAARSVQPVPVSQPLTLSESAEKQSDPMIEKYVDVLEGIYYDYALPDGQRLDPFANDPDYPNEFAIFDVDGDGEEELLIRYTNTYTAGMFGAVYGYDHTQDKLTTQLFEFPSMNFYPNGTVEVGWSHNQGLAGRFWPCTFYCYDAPSDRYIPVACADAWDREFFETDYDGNPFPAQADTSGDGIVYYIFEGDQAGEPAPISQPEFTAWYNDLVGFDPSQDTPWEHALDIPFQPLDEANIAALT